ncbi:3'(2'),5'-bisphosphate nucleotidase CysQ [Flavobacteriaceae bacterium]|nr:3'(2'),5'-bisphosphate nucleotidase CysQ [Flavobacteriaceae bacterium]
MKDYKIIPYKKSIFKSVFEASKEILKIYSSKSITYDNKKDLSPITQADKISNKILIDALQKTGIPIISEEMKNCDFNQRKNWEHVWLIDPLDGTKEFLNKSDNFTINIALIENQNPVFGIVYVPVTRELYFAEKGIGSFKIENILNVDELESLPKIDLSKQDYPSEYTVVASKSHLNSQTSDFINKKKDEYKNVSIRYFGSSLKICKVAEGKGSCYPRLSPTMEWDTAAAHSIIKYSGKNILNYFTKTELKYNKENLLNPFFVAE